MRCDCDALLCSRAPMMSLGGSYLIMIVSLEVGRQSQQRDRRRPFQQGFDDGRVAAARRQVQRRVAFPVPGVYVHLNGKGAATFVGGWNPAFLVCSTDVSCLVNWRRLAEQCSACRVAHERPTQRAQHMLARGRRGHQKHTASSSSAWQQSGLAGMQAAGSTAPG